jgi:hypothetical protein
MSGHMQKRARLQQEQHGTSHLEAASSSSDLSDKSPLWKLLMRKYAWGSMSASDVQQLAQAAVQSGASKHDLQELASIGAHGNAAGNAQRDLNRLLTSEVAVPSPTRLKTPMMAADGVKVRDYEIMLPHDWIHALVQRGVASELLGFQRKDLFWGKLDMKHNPQIKDSKHFFCTIDHSREIVMPLMVHGDGAPHTEVDSLVVFSMRSILTDYAVSMSQFLLWAMPKSAMHTTSLQPVWDLVCWSFNALAEGTQPVADVSGRMYKDILNRTPEEEMRYQLAGQNIGGGSLKIRCIIMVISGDIEWFCSQFNFPYAMSNAPCPYCKCDNLLHESRVPFTDFRSNAEWKNAICSAEELKARCGGHPLMKVLGVNVHTIKLDTLHLVDLGVASHCYGNLLWCILEDHLEGNRVVALQELNRLVADAYNSLQMPAQKRIGMLKLRNLRSSASDYPILSHIKGRKVRWFSKVAIILASKFKTAEKTTHHRLAMVKALDSVYMSLDKPDLIYTSSLQSTFEKNVDAFLAHYGMLASLSMQANQIRYSIVQKHHLLAHLPSQSRFIAPRCCWTYGGESFMGLMVRLSSTCVRGTPAFKMPTKLYQKNRLAMHLIWKHGLEFHENSDGEDAAEM